MKNNLLKWLLAIIACAMLLGCSSELVCKNDEHAIEHTTKQPYTEPDQAAEHAIYFREHHSNFNGFDEVVITRFFGDFIESDLPDMRELTIRIETIEGKLIQEVEGLSQNDTALHTNQVILTNLNFNDYLDLSLLRFRDYDNDMRAHLYVWLWDVHLQQFVLHEQFMSIVHASPTPWADFVGEHIRLSKIGLESSGWMGYRYIDGIFTRIFTTTSEMFLGENDYPHIKRMRTSKQHGDVYISPSPDSWNAPAPTIGLDFNLALLGADFLTGRISEYAHGHRNYFVEYSRTIRNGTAYEVFATSQSEYGLLVISQADDAGFVYLQSFYVPVWFQVRTDDRLILLDLTGNGTLDILVLDHYQGTQGWALYNAFINQNGGYVPLKFPIPNPRFDAEEQLFASQVRNWAASHSWFLYEYQDGEIVMAYKLTREWDWYDEYEELIYIIELAGGKLTDIILRESVDYEEMQKWDEFMRGRNFRNVNSFIWD